MSCPGAQRVHQLPRLVAFTSRDPAASRRPVGRNTALRLLRAGWRIEAQWADASGSLRLLMAIPNPQQQNDVEMRAATLGDDETFLEAEALPGGQRTAKQAIAELVAACGLGPSD